MFNLEPQFELKSKEGDKLSYQCNLCKPKTRIISANTKTRFNLKRHLSTLHSQKDVDAYEIKIKKKKPTEISGGSAGPVQVYLNTS